MEKQGQFHPHLVHEKPERKGWADVENARGLRWLNEAGEIRMSQITLKISENKQANKWKPKQPTKSGREEIKAR
jgi:hypothetical protein